MRIDCQECSMYQTSHCDDCLVTALLHPPDDIVEIDDELDPQLQALTGAGLIPVLRFRPRAPDEAPPGDLAGTA
jgi:hypothetical protein